MDNLEIVIAKRYATKKNLDEISRIAPDAKITIYKIQKRYKIITVIRGGLRRIVPFDIYKFLPKKIENLAKQQKLIWIDPPGEATHTNSILLVPTRIEPDIAEELQSRLHPRWIHSIATGIDHLPPVPEPTIVTSSKGVHSGRIAEFVMALIFAMAKNLPEHFNLNRKRVWKSLSSTMVAGASIGIVGLGSIGAEIAKIGKTCGMEVWATKRHMTPQTDVDFLLPPEKLSEMLRQVDYVVLAIPLTEETYHLIGKAELGMMKKTACLINICRGSVVDEDHLYDALKNKRIRGACCDIFKNEEALPKNSRFYKLPNLLITSWSAWESADADEQRMNLFFENLKRFLCGKELLSLADNTELRYLSMVK